jgi:hypothetical protein
LHETLRDGVLDGYVRDPDTGELFRLSGTDWHSLRLWRETIISGFVRAWPEDLLVRHEGRRVLLSAAEFAEWLKAFKAVVPSSVASLPTPSAPEQSPAVAPSSAASPPTPEAPEQPCSPGEAGAQLQASKVDGIVGPAPGQIPAPLPPSQGSAGPDEGVGPEPPKPPADIEPISVRRRKSGPPETWNWAGIPALLKEIEKKRGKPNVFESMADYEEWLMSNVEGVNKKTHAPPEITTVRRAIKRHKLDDLVTILKLA